MGRGLNIPKVRGSTYHGYNSKAVFSVIKQCKIQEPIRAFFLNTLSLIYVGNIIICIYRGVKFSSLYFEHHHGRLNPFISTKRRGFIIP